MALLGWYWAEAGGASRLHVKCTGHSCISSPDLSLTTNRPRAAGRTSTSRRPTGQHFPSRIRPTSFTSSMMSMASGNTLAYASLHLRLILPVMCDSTSGLQAPHSREWGLSCRPASDVAPAWLSRDVVQLAPSAAGLCSHAPLCGHGSARLWPKQLPKGASLCSLAG